MRIRSQKVLYFYKIKRSDTEIVRGRAEVLSQSEARGYRHLKLETLLVCEQLFVHFTGRWRTRLAVLRELLVEAFALGRPCLKHARLDGKRRLLEVFML